MIKEQVITEDYAIYNSDCMYVLPTLKNDSIDKRDEFYNYLEQNNIRNQCLNNSKKVREIYFTK